MTLPPEPLLDVRDLVVAHPGGDPAAPAVSSVGFSVSPGEAVALVGESGSGKSTTALAILRLLPRGTRIDGRILFRGADLVTLDDRALREIRGRKIAMIFQEPMASLNPVHSVGRQIVEAIRLHRPLGRTAAKARALELMQMVGLPDPAARFDDFPHQFSGGQQQRVMIAMAISCEPDLLIADEPTTALDATVQLQILELLDRLRRELGMGLLLISHDLKLVERWTDRVIVLHHGEKLEEMASHGLSDGSARHAYTCGLIGASLRLEDRLHYTTHRLAEVRAEREASGLYRFDILRRPVPPPVAAETATPALLSVRDLRVSHSGRSGAKPAVDGVSLDIAPGEALGLVGESGSGKSTLARAIARLGPRSGGQVLLRGQETGALAGSALRQMHRDVQMIFQDPFSSLNPRHTVGRILETPLLVEGGHDAATRRRRVAEALERVGLPADAVRRLPQEFSGGQRQRIGIARALLPRPSLIICDEPVSALDVSVQAQILNLLSDLKAELGLSCLFISHDLAVVQFISDRIIVMQEGRIVDQGAGAAFWDGPRAPYTSRLIAAA